MFYGLITPMRLIMRLCGNNRMRRTYESGVERYRVVKCPHPGAHDTTVLTETGHLHG